MENQTNTQITHLSLMRKYGNIMHATSEELKAAVANIPKGKNPLQHLFESACVYEKEVEMEAKLMGMRPAVCFNRDGLCEDDHCRCWDDIDQPLGEQSLATK